MKQFKAKKITTTDLAKEKETYKDLFYEIDKVKTQIQRGGKKYVVGVKFITYEDVNIVLKTIKKDISIYPNISGFIIQDNTIEVRLSNNATLYTYYFVKEDILTEVIKELPKFKKGITNLNEINKY